MTDFKVGDMVTIVPLVNRFSGEHGRILRAWKPERSRYGLFEVVEVSSKWQHLFFEDELRYMIEPKDADNG